MATIGVKAIQTVRGDLDTLAIGNSRDSAKFNARLHDRDTSGLERHFGLLPQAAATHVNIVAGASHQGDAAPNRPRTRPQDRPPRAHAALAGRHRSGAYR